MSEHSDRARYVTEQVSLWIQNDGDHHPFVMRLIEQMESNNAVADYLKSVLKYSPPYGSAPWQVAQELAANDYDRINWDDVVRNLMGD